MLLDRGYQLHDPQVEITFSVSCLRGGDSVPLKELLDISCDVGSNLGPFHLGQSCVSYTYVAGPSPLHNRSVNCY